MSLIVDGARLSKTGELCIFITDDSIRSYVDRNLGTGVPLWAHDDVSAGIIDSIDYCDTDMKQARIIMTGIAERAARKAQFHIDQGKRVYLMNPTTLVPANALSVEDFMDMILQHVRYGSGLISGNRYCPSIGKKPIIGWNSIQLTEKLDIEFKLVRGHVVHRYKNKELWIEAFKERIYGDMGEECGLSDYDIITASGVLEKLSPDIPTQIQRFREALKVARDRNVAIVKEGVEVIDGIYDAYPNL